MLFLFGQHLSVDFDEVRVHTQARHDGEKLPFFYRIALKVHLFQFGAALHTVEVICRLSHYGCIFYEFKMKDDCHEIILLGISFKNASISQD
jgi:hypothetical protein